MHHDSRLRLAQRRFIALEIRALAAGDIFLPLERAAPVRFLGMGPIASKAFMAACKAASRDFRLDSTLLISVVIIPL